MTPIGGSNGFNPYQYEPTQEPQKKIDEPKEIVSASSDIDLQQAKAKIRDQEIQQLELIASRALNTLYNGNSNIEDQMIAAQSAIDSYKKIISLDKANYDEFLSKYHPDYPLKYNSFYPSRLGSIYLTICEFIYFNEPDEDLRIENEGDAFIEFCKHYDDFSQQAIEYQKTSYELDKWQGLGSPMVSELGFSYLRLGELASLRNSSDISILSYYYQAEKCLIKCIEHSNHPINYYYLAKCYDYLGKYKQLLSYSENSICNYEKSIESCIGYCKCCLELFKDNTGIKHDISNSILDYYLKILNETPQKNNRFSKFKSYLQQAQQAILSEKVEKSKEEQIRQSLRNLIHFQNRICEDDFQYLNEALDSQKEIIEFYRSSSFETDPIFLDLPFRKFLITHKFDEAIRLIELKKQMISRSECKAEDNENIANLFLRKGNFHHLIGFSEEIAKKGEPLTRDLGNLDLCYFSAQSFFLCIGYYHIEAYKKAVDTYEKEIIRLNWKTYFLPEVGLAYLKLGDIESWANLAHEWVKTGNSIVISEVYSQIQLYGQNSPILKDQPFVQAFLSEFENLDQQIFQALKFKYDGKTHESIELLKKLCQKYEEKLFHFSAKFDPIFPWNLYDSLLNCYIKEPVDLETESFESHCFFTLEKEYILKQLAETYLLEGDIQKAKEIAEGVINQPSRVIMAGTPLFPFDFRWIVLNNQILKAEEGQTKLKVNPDVSFHFE